jgi:hypothetical protein
LPGYKSFIFFHLAEELDAKYMIVKELLLNICIAVSYGCIEWFDASLPACLRICFDLQEKRAVRVLARTALSDLCFNYRRLDGTTTPSLSLADSVA